MKKKCDELETVEFKNYKELCEKLNLPVRSGNSKVSQLKFLNYFCDLDKEGTKYMFSTVYDDPDTRMIQEIEIISEIEQILLMAFLEKKSKSPQLLLDNYGFWKLFGFINNKYSVAVAENQFSVENNVSEAQLEHYKEKSQKRFRDILMAALKQMKNRSYLEFYETKIIKYKEGNFTKQKEATPEEIQRVLEYQSMVMNEMGYTDLNKIHKAGKKKEFYKKRNDKIQEHEENWLYYSSGYKIIVNKDKWLKNGLRRNLEEKQKCQSKINANVSSLILQSGTTSYENYLDNLSVEFEEYKKWHPNENVIYSEVEKTLPTYERKGVIMDEAYIYHLNLFVKEFILLMET